MVELEYADTYHTGFRLWSRIEWIIIFETGVDAWRFFGNLLHRGVLGTQSRNEQNRAVGVWNSDWNVFINKSDISNIEDEELATFLAEIIHKIVDYVRLKLHIER